MALDEAYDSDILREVEGIKFIIEKKIDKNYSGVTIDYRKKTFKEGFIITSKE